MNIRMEIFQKSGLESTFRIPLDNPHRDERVKVAIEKEAKKDGQTFRLIASSGFNYLSPNGQSWKAGLGDAIFEKQASLSVVLESPFSDFAKTRALANKVTHHHWDEKVSLFELEKLNMLDNVTIKVTDHPVNCSLFFTSNSVFYDPYLWARPRSSRKTENNFWVFEFKKVDDLDYDCYNLLLGHFNFLESLAVPLQEFLGQDHESYKILTDKFQKEIASKMMKLEDG